MGIFHHQLKTGTGIIPQDAKEEVIIAASNKEHEVNNTTEIELLVMCRRLQLCFYLGIHELILESDSLLMVKDLASSWWRVIVFAGQPTSSKRQKS